MALTQELIADMLGVRREGVTEAVGRLQKAGLIHCSRGHIVVVDRPALEAHACGCYAVVKREYDGLLADYRHAFPCSPRHEGPRLPAAKRSPRVTVRHREWHRTDRIGYRKG